MEAMSRLRGELLAVGFDVRRVPVGAGHQWGSGESRAWLEALAREESVDAVMGVVGDAVPLAVDVWVMTRSPRHVDVTRVERNPTTVNASARLAIRAVDVLRSRLIEHDMAASASRGQLAADPSPTEPDERLETRDARHPGGKRFGVELGAAALTSFDGMGPVILPITQLHWEIRPGLAMHVAAAGLGSRATVAGRSGHAQVTHQYGVLGGAHRLHAERRVWPFVSLAAGALQTAVEGEADAPRQGHRHDELSFLLDFGIGAGLDLPKPFTLTLAAHLHVAEPYVAVRFEDDVVATTGRPNLVLTLALGAWP